MVWVDHFNQPLLYRPFYVEHARARPASPGRFAMVMTKLFCRNAQGFLSRHLKEGNLKQFQASVEDFRIALAALPGDPDLQENLHQAERYLKAQRNGAKSK